MTAVQPEAFERRTPCYRLHGSLGAVFEAVGDIAAVAHYGDAEGEAAALRSLAFADLNALPRCGFKNAGAPEWLAAQGVALPAAANEATRQDDGGLCARLGGTDILIAGDPWGASDRPNALLQRWSAETSRPIGWDAHREEGFSWFLLLGAQAPELWSRVCAVDLRPGAFPDLAVAQTRAFGMGGVIVRADLAGVPAYHLFFDIASSDFLIEAVRRTMRPFEGRLVGLAALRSLRP